MYTIEINKRYNGHISNILRLKVAVVTSDILTGVGSLLDVTKAQDFEMTVWKDVSGIKELTDSEMSSSRVVQKLSDYFPITN